MLVEYVQAAMRRAKYELLKEDKTFYARIPECRGVWSNAKTLEKCREELQSVLEDWILVRVRNALKVPVLDGIDINPKPRKREVA